MEIDWKRLFRPGGSSAGWPRLPTILPEAMVATSHPLATRAGVQALERGGNAVDAALAAAAMLCVGEPGHTGVGGDAFALLWWDGQLVGLNGSGRSPATLDGSRVDSHGPRSVTVPGAIAAWSDLAERFGRFGLDAAVAPAADAAAAGVAATARVAEHWQRARGDGRAPWPAPRPGERYRLPELAATLRSIAEQGPAAFYGGAVAAAIAGASWLDEADLAAHRSEWVQPLRLPYKGVEVCELPPNGQGATALLALAIEERLDPALGLHGRIESVKLALADAYAAIADAPLPGWFLDAAHARGRAAAVRADRALDPGSLAAPLGGTTYLCAVDGDRNAISFIQSTYDHFGSGVVAGKTGIVLQNRAAGFVERPGHPNRLAAGRRPFHTIIPGMLVDGGKLIGPFGVMGGPMQAQGHAQVVWALSSGLDPQGALDAPRFRVEEGRRVALEPGLWPHADELVALSHEVVRADEPHGFGVGQIVLAVDDALVGGSDSRGDGHVGGL